MLPSEKATLARRLAGLIEKLASYVDSPPAGNEADVAALGEVLDRIEAAHEAPAFEALLVWLATLPVVEGGIAPLVVKLQDRAGRLRGLV